MLQLLLSSAKQTSALPFVDSSIFFQHLPTSLGTIFTKVFDREKLILYFASAQALSKSCNCVKCPNREFLLVRIFPHPYSARVQENTDQEKLRIWTYFTQCVPVNRFFSGQTGIFFTSLMVDSSSLFKEAPRMYLIRKSGHHFVNYGLI